MSLEPLLDRVLVKRLAEDRIGVLHVPDTVRKVSLRGRVISCGKDCEWVEPGDEIVFGKYAAFTIPLDDLTEIPEHFREVLIMNEGDILCKIHRGDATT